MPNTDSNGENASGGYARFVGLGFTFVFVIGLFVAAGYVVDRFLSTLPLFLLLGIVVGFMVGMYYVYAAIKKLGR